MAYRIMEIPDSEATDSDFTETEIVGVSVLVSHHFGEEDELNVYWRAAKKLYAFTKRIGDRKH